MYMFYIYGSDDQLCATWNICKFNLIIKTHWPFIFDYITLYSFPVFCVPCLASWKQAAFKKYPNQPKLPKDNKRPQKYY